jgi:hypothetical protein
MSRTVRQRFSDFLDKRTQLDEYAPFKWLLCVLICIFDLVAIGNLAWVADKAFQDLLRLEYYEAGSYVIWGLVVVS